MRVLNRLSAVDQRWLAGMDSVINKETLKLNLLLTLLSPATRWERLSIYQVFIWIDHWPVDLGWGGISKFDIQSKYQMTLLSNYGLRSPLRHWPIFITISVVEVEILFSIDLRDWWFNSLIFPCAPLFMKNSDKLFSKPVILLHQTDTRPKKI